MTDLKYEGSKPFYVHGENSEYFLELDGSGEARVISVGPNDPDVRSGLRLTFAEFYSSAPVEAIASLDRVIGDALVRAVDSASFDDEEMEKLNAWANEEMEKLNAESASLHEEMEKLEARIKKLETHEIESTPTEKPRLRLV